MTQTEIIEYAIIGLTTKIVETERSMMRGQQIIKDRNNGIQKDMSHLKNDEIKKIVETKQKELDKLVEKEAN